MKIEAWCSSLIILVLITVPACDQNGLYNPSDVLREVPVLELYLDQDAYVSLLANKDLNYRVATNLFFEDQFLQGTIRASGAGSRASSRWSYRVKLKEGVYLREYNTFNLSAQINDPTMLYTTIVSELYRQAGFYVFDNFHVFVKLNNTDMGLYQFIELIDQHFFEIRSLPVDELYQGGFESKFSFDDDYNPQFHFDKEIPDDDNYSNLYDLIVAVDTAAPENIFSSLGKLLDIPQYIKYHALTTLINNPDAFENNFFILKETPNTPYKFLPWDFDRAFEPGNDVGLYGENAIIRKLFQNDSTFNLYKSELDTMLQTIFTLENVDKILGVNVEKIRGAYNIDPYLGAGRYDLDEKVESLKVYIANRRQFFLDKLPGFTRPNS